MHSKVRHSNKSPVPVPGRVEIDNLFLPANDFELDEVMSHDDELLLPQMQTK